MEKKKYKLTLQSYSNTGKSSKYTIKRYSSFLFVIVIVIFQEAADARKLLLADSYEAQQYFADALEAELRMKDLEPVVRSSDYGKDEDMAEVCNLQKERRGHLHYFCALNL